MKIIYIIICTTRCLILESFLEILGLVSTNIQKIINKVYFLCSCLEVMVNFVLFYYHPVNFVVLNKQLRNKENFILIFFFFLFLVLLSNWKIMKIRFIIIFSHFPIIFEKIGFRGL